MVWITLSIKFLPHENKKLPKLWNLYEGSSVYAIFSDLQTNDKGKTYNELLYVQKRNALAEQWTGKRLGVEGAQQLLGFELAMNGEEFIKNGINFGDHGPCLGSCKNKNLELPV